MATKQHVLVRWHRSMDKYMYIIYYNPSGSRNSRLQSTNDESTQTSLYKIAIILDIPLQFVSQRGKRQNTSNALTAHFALQVNDMSRLACKFAMCIIQGPLLLTWINFNPIMECGSIITSIIKCGMKILIHSQTSTVAPLRFGNG